MHPEKTSMTHNDVYSYCLELMASADMVSVASIDEDGIPQIRVMFNLRNRRQFPSLARLFEEHGLDLMIYLGTNTSSAKIAQIKANPAISVLYSNDQKFHSLMLSGYAETVEDQGIRNALWQNGWELYYPTGPGDPDYTVLRLLPTKAKGWRGDLGAFSFQPGSRR